MDFSTDDSFDFNAFINWPDDPSAAHAGAEDGYNHQPLEIPLGSASLGRAQPLAKSIPGYSADSANEDTHTITTAPMPSQGDANTLNSDQESSSISTAKKCACMVCLAIGVVDEKCPAETPCHFSCGWLCRSHETAYWAAYHRAVHEKTHFRQDRESPFSCIVEDCRGYSSKRWSDLIRHTTARHCKNPSMFVCSVIGCKHHGEGNGFTRKDKLTDHHRSMHQGQNVPGHAGRVIMPAPGSSYAEASGTSSSGAYGA